MLQCSRSAFKPAEPAKRGWTTWNFSSMVSQWHRPRTAPASSTPTTTSQSAISNWIAGMGTVPACSPCVTLSAENLHLAPNLDWISDAALLGSDLSQRLVAIHRNRTRALSQFYVSHAQGGEPYFDHELSYPSLKLPDSGYQLLALFRFWNMVEYFSPNRDIMSDDPASSRDYWSEVLVESIPRIALAADSLSYQQELIRFVAKINDTHSNLWSSLYARPPIGSCYLPVDVRFVEGVPVVLRYTSATGGPASGLMPGDVIRQLNGIAISELVAQWTPFYADSNHAARLRDIGRDMIRGSCDTTSVLIQRGDQTLSLAPARMPMWELDFSASYTHDLPGDTFQMLSADVAYLKVSSAKAADSAKYIEAAAGTRGLIIDIRNYPSDFVMFPLGSLLVSEPVDFVRSTKGDTTNPGAFY